MSFTSNLTPIGNYLPDTKSRLYIYMCVCVCLCVYACLWHVSMRIFNLSMISLRKIRLRALVTDINNHLAWKGIPPPTLPYGLRPCRGWQACWQRILCQTNRRPRPNQSKSDIYVFSVIFHSPPFLKVHKNPHSMVKWLFLYYRKHPNT